MAVTNWNSVWVTGASTGIGEALVRRLDGTGPAVAASARSADRLKSLAMQGARIADYPIDVTDASAVEMCVKAIEAAQGPIDLAVLNAGAWTLMDTDEIDLQGIRLGVEVNYMGVIHSLMAVLPGMLARGGGHIAITASVSGYRGLPKAVAYGPMKSALINLAETLKCELAPRGITVSLINPGFVDTPMTQRNPFPMPELISADEAAVQILAGLEKRKFEIAFPSRFAAAMKLLRILPDRLYFWIVRRFILKN
ncbi:MAG: SDR family NAD(P)-dependent oxidoreductase [Rhizobiaceae bacterium]